MNRAQTRNTIISPKCTELLEYWWRLQDAKGGRIPVKREFDPTEVPRILPNMATHDFRTPGKFVVRLFGTALQARMGLDMTGRDYLDYVPAHNRDQIYNSLRMMAEQPCAFRTVVETVQLSDKFTVSENVGVPIMDDQCDLPIIVMVSDLVEAPHYALHPSDSAVEILGALELEYIDVGFGIPADEVAEAVLKTWKPMVWSR